MDSRVAQPRFLIVLASVAFVSLGLPDGIVGVAWPSIRASFGLPIDALGALLLAFTSGYVVSSFSSGFVLFRMGLGTLLALSCLLTSASLMGYAVTPSWWPMVGLAGVAGLGAGAIDAGINGYASLHLGPRLMSWLHACWGMGAATGPLVMTAVLETGRPWQRGYLIVGIAQLLLAVAFALSGPAWSRGGPTAQGGAHAFTAALAAPAPRRGATALGVLTFFVYTGLEGAFGVWSYTVLTEGRGVPAAVAGACVSSFFGGLTLGRLLSAFAGGPVPVTRMLRVCLIVIALASATFAADLWPPLSFAAVVVAGIACGPVFPSLMSTTPARVGAPKAARAVGFQIGAAALGSALLPAGIGWVAGRAGLESVGGMLLLLALVVLGVQEVLLEPLRSAERPRGLISDPTIPGA
jgi:fucose permease